MKILYVSKTICDSKTGGAIASQNNLDLLSSIKSVSSVTCLTIGGEGKGNNIKIRRGKVHTLINSLKGYSGGINFNVINQVLEFLRLFDFDVVWLDGSVLGRLSKEIKIFFPEVKIVTFFHNVEYDFVRSITKKNKLLYSSVVFSSDLNERLSVRYSDFFFCLTEEDQGRLQQLYGLFDVEVLPLSFKNIVRKPSLRTDAESNKMLFVGSDFPPNIEALKFLCSKVMPHTTSYLVVVGKGLERYKAEFESKNIKIVGTVDFLADYYSACDFVLAPIFSGAGMKVKVGEAFSYGKVVIGTSFAFTGYPYYKGSESFKIVANTAEDYISLVSQKYPNVSNQALSYIEHCLSFELLSDRLNSIFNDKINV